MWKFISAYVDGSSALTFVSNDVAGEVQRVDDRVETFVDTVGTTAEGEIPIARIDELRSVGSVVGSREVDDIAFRRFYVDSVAGLNGAVVELDIFTGVELVELSFGTVVLVTPQEDIVCFGSGIHAESSTGSSVPYIVDDGGIVEFCPVGDMYNGAGRSC